jgi:sirohydrochlorin cobaltochelatase
VHALLLFSHGSLLCGAGEALEAHAARLRACKDFDGVWWGYLNYSEPLFLDAVTAAIEAGATRITVVPYFLVSGFFITRSLPPLLEEARQRFPAVIFTVAEALNFDERLADALLEAAATAQGPKNWRDPLKRAAQSCRPSPDCPLYATSACPKVPVRNGETS